ncbi:chromosome segregation SMC family protein [Amorphus coralli]|uniref:chromosome segregation SMC family protein n=1 Tax=Amorphus coralli TaxID=340680 RepID=UPI000366BC15|nr:AAA family ATPase [Amorphus coralli]
MKFTRLRLTGFKSFVDPTDFLIEDGLTGVVGPNGCGKSNLVEALRWVMGESSYKSMRASGMDDVIFAGSGKRPARNVAEVSVLLDNSDRSAPVGFNTEDTLEISRRIERESGSAYRVNGREVRARDVQLLFADASTGSRSPSMVRQGQIGELINAKPTSRRQILEEAAGISGLHARRHEAELRLRAAETNLDRVEDVVGEIGTQLESLKRQARQANRYRGLSSEIRKIEALVLHLRWRAARTAAASAEDTLSEAKDISQRASEAQTTAARDQAVSASAMPKLREREAEAGATLQRLRHAASQLEDEERRMRERLGELERRIGQIAADIERESAVHSDAEEAVARLDAEHASLTADEEGAGDRRAAAEARLAEEQEALARAEAAQAEATRAEAGAAAERRRLEQERARTTNEVSRATSERDKVRADLARIQGELERTSGVAQARAALESAEATEQAAIAASDDAEAKAREAREAADLARAPVSEREKEISALETEKRTLETVLATIGDDRFPPVVDRLKVDRGYEVALGAALGDDLDAALDNDAAIFWGGTGDPSDDPLLPEGAESLASHVRAPAELSRRLAQIGVVDAEAGPALQTMLRPGQRLVSKQGDFWRWDGLTARADAPTAAAQRLAQKNRLEALAGELETAHAALERDRQALDTARTASAQAAEAERVARDTARAASQASRDARTRLASAEKEATQLENRRSALTEAATRAQASVETAETAAAEATKAFEAAPDLSALAKAREAADASVSSLRRSAAEARARLDGERRESELRTNRKAAIAREIESWRNRVATAAAQREELSRRHGEAEAERARLLDAPEDHDRKRRALNSEIATAETELAAASDARAAAETAVAETDRTAKMALEALSTAREGLARAEERLTAARERQAAVAEEIEETLECGPEEAGEIGGIKPDAPLPDMDGAENRLERLKAERERLGGVNLRAEEEVREMEERRDTLTRERDDIIAAIAQFRQAISNLNREARARLTDAFDTVNEHFKTLFVHLFGGGEAELTMVEADDPLEAGLEIIARPPGKKPQVLSLLSGGEQALAAMALIFAVFLTNPAPICVLDEVDAPLDDANVERFCDLVEEMTRRTDTRFMIITHNPITMARMHRLFGVTMAERGVSQLVSVDLETAERFREAV